MAALAETDLAEADSACGVHEMLFMSSHMLLEATIKQRLRSQTDHRRKRLCRHMCAPEEDLATEAPAKAVAADEAVAAPLAAVAAAAHGGQAAVGARATPAEETVEQGVAGAGEQATGVALVWEGELAKAASKYLQGETNTNRQRHACLKNASCSAS